MRPGPAPPVSRFENPKMFEDRYFRKLELELGAFTMEWMESHALLRSGQPWR